MIEAAFQNALDASSEHVGRTSTTHNAIEFLYFLEDNLGPEWDQEYGKQIRSLIKKREPDIIWTSAQFIRIT